jgi:hypothetical protein
MKVRVIKAYGQWSVGHIFTEMPGNVGRTLIARGLVEEVAENEPQKPIQEHKQFTSPMDRMMRDSVKRGPGRPRKVQ